MNQKLALRRYAKKPLGTYPEVDNFIIHDPKASKPRHRYLVDGEEFAASLTSAREKMVERLKISDPKVTAATEVHYTPATGFKYNHRNKPTDEGEQQMAEAIANAGTESKSEAISVMKGPAELQQELDNWLKANPEPAKGTPERNTWVKNRTTMKMRITVAKNKAEGKPTPGRKAAANPIVHKEKPVVKKDQQPAPTQKPAAQPRAPMAMMQPMMIETGGIKITVNNADQMDMAIGSLKKHSVI